MKKVAKWLKSPGGITLSAAIVGPLLTIVYDVCKSKPILSTICSGIIFIWRLILYILNFDLKVWWVLLGFLALLIALWVYVKIYELRNSESIDPSFLKYKQDNIYGWKWEWTWEKRYDGMYDVENLHPICTECGTPLVLSYNCYNSIACPRCGHDFGSKRPDMNIIKTIITDNAKRGLYQQKSIANTD